MSDDDLWVPLADPSKLSEHIDFPLKTPPTTNGQGADDDAEAMACEITKRRAERERKKKQTIAEKLIEIGTDERFCELFHTPDGEAYCDWYGDGHRETHPLRSQGCKALLRREYYLRHKGSPNAEAMTQAIEMLTARALYDGECHSIFLRMAHVDDAIYLDLCDKEWRAVEITEDGWKVTDEPPVRFVRKKKMLPIPEPENGGEIATLGGLCDHLNLDPESQEYKLLASWLLGTLRGKGPFPVLGIGGEQGSAKSDLLYLLKRLVDPTKGGLRGPPKDDRDLFISALNGYILAFDNFSHISADLADSMCRLATGAGFSTRALFTDDDEVVFDGQRPIAITAITQVATRSDLADRSMLVHLKAIPEEKRKLQEDVYRDFDAARPRILGALLNVVAHGLMRYPDMRPNKLPRMADFAKWMLACETAMWDAGMFTAAYEVSHGEASTNVLEADLVATALLPWIARVGAFEDTATALLTTLEGQIDDQTRRRREWPKSASALSGRLTRLMPPLRKAGVTIANQDRTKKSRKISIRYERLSDDGN